MQNNLLRTLRALPATVTLLAATGTLLAATGGAQVLSEPGSLLIYPEYDNETDATQTYLTVTNTSPTKEIWVHFEYVNHLTCLEFNRELHLTADDTVTLLTQFHNPFDTRGYVYVYAQNEDGQAIGFDHLIGSMMQLEVIEGNVWCVNAFAFRAKHGQGDLTDTDGDGNLDLDHQEYNPAFDSIMIPRFVATGRNELILLNLTGGSSFNTIVDFLIYNDNEEFFSWQHEFYCWERRPLLDIAPIFGNPFLQTTGHDETESVLDLENGWMRIDGRTAYSTQRTLDDPAILGVLVERMPHQIPSGSLGIADASLPFTEGRQFNATLLPHGPQGDNNDM